MPASHSRHVRISAHLGAVVDALSPRGPSFEAGQTQRDEDSPDVFFSWSFENCAIQFKFCCPESFLEEEQVEVHVMSEGSDTESCQGTTQGNEVGVRRRLLLTWDDNACPSVRTAEALVNNLVQRIGPVVPGGVLPRGNRDCLQ